MRQGHECLAVALCEKIGMSISERVEGDSGWTVKIEEIVPNKRESLCEHPNGRRSEASPIESLRLPNWLAWEERVELARKRLRDFQPDWVSLQFVPFGFHPKGLPFGLSRRLTKIIGTNRLHIMFHELWVGLGENAPVKHRAWGALQRMFILELVARLHPQRLETQAEPYRKALAASGINASILPLFGNIPIAPGDGWDELLEPMVSKAAGGAQERSALYLAGVFGAVHPEWDGELAVRALLSLVQRFRKRLMLIFFGKSNLSAEWLNRLKYKLHRRADVVVVGEKPALEISRILQSIDLGLATSPRQLIQKSGTVAAMLEHGLPVLVTRDDWHLRGVRSCKNEESSKLLSPDQFALLKNLPTRDPNLPAETHVEQVARQMLRAMQA